MKGHLCELQARITWNVANRDAVRGVFLGGDARGGFTPYGIFSLYM